MKSNLEKEIRIKRDNVDYIISSLLKPRSEKAYKGDFGKLGIIAGSDSFRGCASLACRAALRAGAGIVKLISTEKVCSTAVASNPEITLQVTNRTESGGISRAGISSSIKGTTTVLAGCGMTISAETLGIVLDVLSSGIPTVLDADALNSLVEGSEVDSLSGTNTIVTPHVGEAARLVGCSAGMIKQNLAETCRRFAATHRCIAVFKDYITAVSDGDTLALLDIPNGGMARGGSGDVLAGVIASFRAQGYEPFDAALLGVCLHAVAGLKAFKIHGNGMLPSDVADLILNEKW